MTYFDDEKLITEFMNGTKAFYNIYRIYDIDTDESYYGSTSQTITKRLQKHESDYRRYKKGKKKYVTSSFDIIKNNNYKITLVHRICSSKTHAEDLESVYIKGCDCVNRNIPGRTRKEYYGDNKDKSKQYYKDNVKRIKARVRVKYNCECGGIYTHDHKAKHFKTKMHQNYERI